MRPAIVMRTDAGARWGACLMIVLVGVVQPALGEEPSAPAPPAPAEAPATPTPPKPAAPQAAAPTPANGTFSGVVRATASNATIEGARIEVLGTDTKARTGNDGTFKVELPAGTYTVRISADGYSNRTIPKLVIKEGKTARVEVKLSEPVKAEKDSIIVNVLARLRRAAESAQ